MRLILINQWSTFDRPVDDEDRVDPEIGEMPLMENQVSYGRHPSEFSVRPIPLRRRRAFGAKFRPLLYALSTVLFGPRSCA